MPVTHRVWTPVPARGMPVRVDPHAPLTHVTRDADGVAVTEDVLCWVVDGVILVHPDRWELLEGALGTGRGP